MAQAFRGEKFGEQLLKQSLWFAQSNGYDAVYLTAFADKEELLHLLRAYGFHETGRRENGERVVEKPICKHLLLPDDATNILEFDRSCYPRFFDGHTVAKFCVPIRGTYHEKLFPEISFRVPLPLFASPELPRERTSTHDQARTPGNTIRKVYLCRAQDRGLKPGDVLLFYLSKDDRLEASQSITTVGIVERWQESSAADDLIRMTAKRSVFSGDELAALQAEAEKPLKVIDFLLVGHSTPPVRLNNLLAAGIFNGRPPQSIARIEESRYQLLKPMLQLGFAI